jgi:hypothetical protein
MMLRLQWRAVREAPMSDDYIEYTVLDVPEGFEAKQLGECLTAIIHMIRREVEMSTNAQVANHALAQGNSRGVP